MTDDDDDEDEDENDDKDENDDEEENDDEDNDLLCRSVSPSAQAGYPPRSPCTVPAATGFKDYDEYK